MGDLIDLIFNFFNFLDAFPALERQYERFRDKDLHIVKRLLSFFIICFVVLIFLGVLFFIIFLGYKLLKK